MCENKILKYNGIDLFKFVMAICVVAIHTHPFENYSNTIVIRLYECIVGCAVPFFFLASGYLLGKKMSLLSGDDEKIKVLKKKLVSIFSMYIIWNIVYLPLALVEYMENGKSIGHNILLYIRGLVFIGEHYNSWILWYLLATIYALALLIVLVKFRVNKRFIVLIGLVLISIYFVWGEINSSAGEIFQEFAILKKAIQFIIGNGKVFSGMFYIAFGIFYADKNVSHIISATLFGVGMVFSFCLDGIIGEYSLIIASIGLFYVVANLKLRDAPYFQIIRKMSTVIYFIHMYVWTIYYTIIYQEKIFGMDSFIVTTVICIVISFVYVKMNSYRWKNVRE